jgi:hypothetical protein
MNTLEAKPTIQEIQLLYVPKEITQDIDSDDNIASFDYYSGIRYCELLGIKQCDNFNQVSDGTGFIVCCGDVMVKVKQTDYPDIKRRVF